MSVVRQQANQNLPPSARYLYGMELLVRTVQSLAMAKDVTEIQSIVAKAARNLTGADGATFVLRDGEFCHYVDEDAISPLWKGKKFPLTACVSGWAMMNKQSALIRDIYDDPRVPVDAYKPTFVKSMVMVPVRIADPIGAIGNYWAKTYVPTPEDVTLLQALADTTAVAIENVRVRARTHDLEEENEEIQNLSLRDELTGLYNRRGFNMRAEAQLEECRAKGHTPCIAFIDVDGLKTVNDQLGHDAGDHLIKYAADVISSAVRDTDIIARLGGDEFCIIADDCPGEILHKRIIQAAKAFNKKGNALRISLSIGTVTPVDENEKLDAMVKRADQAMYIEKQTHKGHR